MKPVRLTKHVREQCLERVRSEEEVVQAIQQGTLCNRPSWVPSFADIISRLPGPGKATTMRLRIAEKITSVPITGKKFVSIYSGRSSAPEGQNMTAQGNALGIGG